MVYTENGTYTAVRRRAPHPKLCPSQFGVFFLPHPLGWSRCGSDNIDFHFLPNVSVLGSRATLCGDCNGIREILFGDCFFVCMLSLSARLDPVYLSVCQDFVSLHSVILFCEVLCL